MTLLDNMPSLFLKTKLHASYFYELSSSNVQQSDGYPSQTTENITYDKIISNRKSVKFLSSSSF